MSKNAKSKIGPGRPKAQVNIPNKRFTFEDLKAANTHVTPLTLRKFIKADAGKKNMSLIVRLKDENREPNSAKGLGRKVFVYCPRGKASTKAPAKASGKSKGNSLKTASQSDVQVTLATPDTAPATVETTPDVAPATVTETPATVEVAPVAA